jgi:flavin reductase
MALTEPVPRPLEPPTVQDDQAVDADLFRHAFRRHAASVVVVTYIDSSGAPRGMTATAVCALSVDPPSLIVCIDRSTLTHEEVMHRRTFAIDMLSTSQRRISAHCSRRGLDKRLRDEWLVPGTGPDEPPHLAGSVAHLVCTIESALDAFTHTIVVGRVRSIWLNPLDPEPLLYHDGAYTRLVSAVGGDGGDILGIAPLALPDPLDDED